MTFGFTNVDEKTSPPRYFFNVGDSDDESHEWDEIQPSTYFQSSQDPHLRLVIYFRQPYQKNQIDVETLFLTTFSRNIEENTVTCTFKGSQDTITLFSFNHMARYSRIEILTKEDKCLKTYENYILNDDIENKPPIVSLDCSLQMRANILTNEEEKCVIKKPKVCRVLFPEATPSLEVQVYDNTIRYGAVVKVDEITVTFRLENQDELTEILPSSTNQDHLQDPQK